MVHPPPCTNAPFPLIYATRLLAARKAEQAETQRQKREVKRLEE